MARTVQQILTAIETDEAARPELAAIDNGSVTGRALAEKTMFAEAANILETIFDRFKTDITTIANNVQSLTPPWYQVKCLEFQYGDTVTLINQVPAYALVDLTKRIVVYAACIEDIINGSILLKVNKTAGALAAGELTAFASYINAIQGAGDKITIVSLDPDLLKIMGTVWYNGQGGLAAVQAAVRAAIANFLLNLPFNGKLQTLDLMEAVRNIPGINDCDFSFQAKQGINPYTAIPPRYDSVSGRVSLETAGGSTLEDLITYISE